MSSQCTISPLQNKSELLIAILFQLRSKRTSSQVEIWEPLVRFAFNPYNRIGVLLKHDILYWMVSPSLIGCSCLGCASVTTWPCLCLRCSLTAPWTIVRAAMWLPIRKIQEEFCCQDGRRIAFLTKDKNAAVSLNHCLSSNCYFCRTPNFLGTQWCPISWSISCQKTIPWKKIENPRNLQIPDPGLQRTWKRWFLCWEKNMADLSILLGTDFSFVDFLQVYLFLTSYRTGIEQVPWDLVIRLEVFGDNRTQ